MIAPFFQRYSVEIPNVAFFKLDVDDVPDVAAELGIRSMPTFLFYENAEKVSEFIGANWRALEVCLDTPSPL
jgi:thioredoxin 1